MNDIQREQTIVAIYHAISNQNYRYARTVLDITLKEASNEMLDKVITLTAKHREIQQLQQHIRELKYEI